MRQMRLLWVALVALALSACMSITTTVKVKSDGSGTVTQKMVMSAEMAEMMKGLAAMGAEEGAAAPELFPEAKLRSKAEEMGAGVKFVSSRKVKENGGEGVEAVYAFKDINTLKVEEKPEPPMEGARSTGESEATEFRLTKLPNGNAQLVVTFPERKPGGEGDKAEKGASPKKEEPPAAGAKPAKKKPDAQQMAQAKKMLKGLRIGLYLDAGKKIVKTDSQFVEGNRVTLMEMDFEALLGNDEKLQEFMGLDNEPSMEEAKKILKGIPGIKLNLDRQVTIEFK